MYFACKYEKACSSPSSFRFKLKHSFQLHITYKKLYAEWLLKL